MPESRAYEQIPFGAPLPVSLCDLLVAARVLQPRRPGITSAGQIIDASTPSPGDFIVMGFDDAVGVYREALAAAAASRGARAFAEPGGLEAPEG